MRINKIKMNRFYENRTQEDHQKKKLTKVVLNLQQDKIKLKKYLNLMLN